MENETKTSQMRQVTTDDRSIFAAGFTMVPNLVLRSRLLPPQAKFIYSLLLSYAWSSDYAWPAMDALVLASGLTRQSISKYLRDLSDCGLVRIVRMNTVPPRNRYELITDLDKLNNWDLELDDLRSAEVVFNRNNPRITR